jgi:hypothetical protein
LGVFTDDFAQVKQVQWKAFRLRLKHDHVPELFSDVLEQLSRFLGPCMVSGNEAMLSREKWIAPGPWIRTKVAD